MAHPHALVRPPNGVGCRSSGPRRTGRRPAITRVAVPNGLAELLARS
jgi:hypothetical protein